MRNDWEVGAMRRPERGPLKQWAPRTRSAAVLIGVLASALLIAPAGASATTLPSTISENTTLNPAGSPYTDPGGGVTIESGVALTIEPGVSLQLEALIANGTLKAEGTEAEPILFTSAEDSEPGQWDGITLNSGSSSLKHDELRYATTAIAVGSGSAPAISDVTIRQSSTTAISLTHSDATVTGNTLISNQSGIGVFGGGSPEIAGNTVEGCGAGEYGILYKDEGKAGGEVNIHGNLVEGCGASAGSPPLPSGYAAISVFGAAGAEVTGASLGENTIRDGGRPIDYDVDPWSATIPADISDNALTSNEMNGIWLTGQVPGSTTWEDHDYPIVLRGDRSLVVAPESSLIVEPGFVLKAEDEAELLVAGEFLAQGTEGNPITITSLRDDSVGGDTNGDGTESVPAPGDWAKINFLEGFESLPPGRGTLEQVNISYGGATPNCEWCAEGGPMLEFQPRWFTNQIADASVVAHSVLTSGKGPAISGQGVSPEIVDNVFSSNGEGMIFTGGGSPEIAENTVKDCASGRSGISYIAPSQGWATGEVRIHDNVLERCGLPEEFPPDPESSAGIEVFQQESIESRRTEGPDEGEGGIKGVTLSGNTVRESGRPISYRMDLGSIPADIVDNTLSDNLFEAVWLSGHISESQTWENPGFPVVTGTRGGYLSVDEGATLTLDPGLMIKAEEGTGISVRGELITAGTSAEPVTISSLKDDSVGGDTNGDGTATSPAPGDWAGIDVAGSNYFTEGGRADIEHLEASYGGNSCESCSGGMVTIGPPSEEVPLAGQTTIKHSRFYAAGGAAIVVGDHSSTAQDFGEEEAPIIEWNKFRSNAVAVEYIPSQQQFKALDAQQLKLPNNDFNGASGPKPYGTGEEVVGPIDPNPWTNLPSPHGHCQGESQCPKGADPISLATGQLDYSHRDLLLTNASEEPLEFSRTYSSGDDLDTGLGPGWAQTGLISASEQESGDVLIIRPNGHQDLFTKTSEGYERPSGVTDSLERNEDGTFSLTMLNGTTYVFDASGRISSITDDHGQATTYGYDGNGRLATISDPSSQTLAFSYNSSNHITSVEDSTGREINFGYSVAGDLETVTDALGGITEYTYDTEHRLKTIKDPRDNVILRNTFDGQGRIVEQRDGLENLWELEYREGETIVTEPEGGRLVYEFDGEDRVTSEDDQLGHTTTTSYDAAGNVDELVKPGGAKWQFGHDAAGNLMSVIDPEEGERSYEYDGQNRPTSVTDERGETWNYEWDEASDLVRVTDPAEGETTFTYDTAGLPLTVTDPNEHTTTFTYDSRGNRLTEEDPLENTTAFGYNDRNQLISKTYPGLEAESYDWDALGDLLSVTTPEGSKTEYVYDANGMPIQVTDPAGNLWEVEYDAMERPTAYVDPIEGRTEIAYDNNLNPVTVTDRRGKETTYAYDLANQLIGIVRPEGGDWEFEYDARGNRSEVVEPRENTATYEYDLLDRMTEVQEPMGATASYVYDPVGNLSSFIDPRENETELTYDELGRLTEIDQPLEKTTTFTYDDAGNRISRTTAAGTLSYDYDAANRLEEIREGESTLRSIEYDAAGRPISAIDAQSDEIEIGYDDDGHVVSMDDGRGQTILREYDSRGNVEKEVDGRGTLEYGYDKLNQLISLTDPQSKVLEFGYDPEGNLTKVELPNGVTTTTEYDDAGRIAEISSLGPKEALLESLEYDYDPFGNRIAQTDRLSQETTYTYDALNRLTALDPPGEGSTAYDYDAAGNRTEAGATTYGFNDLNQLTSASDGTTYDYDDAGRLIETDKGEQSTTYGWNQFDQLIGIDDGSQEVAYTYDALGRRAERSDGPAVEGAHYAGFGDAPILDTDGEASTLRTYVQGPAGLAEERAGGDTLFPLADAEGDVLTHADAEGGVASRQTYDPWGVQLSGPALQMGWLGAQERRSDPSTQLVQMGLRAYAPDQGRFLTEDPVLAMTGATQLSNRYAYAANGPPNATDLTGRNPFDDAVGVGEDIVGGGGEILDSWAEDPFNFGDPRELVISAQEYWVESDSPVSYVAGPAVSMVDLFVNPDRLSYYMKSHPWSGTRPLENCYSGMRAGGKAGAHAGAAGGFALGFGAGLELGPLGAFGVGTVSGAAGYGIGSRTGSLLGCALGAAGGLFE